MSENGSSNPGAGEVTQRGGGYHSNHSSSSAGGIKTLTSSGGATTNGGGLFPAAATSSPAPNWRRSSHLGASGHTSSGGSSGASSGNGAGEWTLWLVMRAMNVVGWCKEQWMLWCAIATVIFAYYVPLLNSSHWVTSICVALVFFLSGTSFPFEELLRHAVNNRLAILVALIHVFVLSPALGLGLSMLPFLKGVPRSEMLLAGFLCVFCLPPSSASALAATGSAAGSESITLCVTAIGSLMALLFSPALMRFTVSDTTSGKSHSKEFGQFIGQFALIVLLPLVIGQMCQFIAFHCMRTRHSNGGLAINTGGGMAAGVVDLKKQMVATATYCSDVCDTNQRNWRGRVRGLVYIIMLFLSYTIFCSLFTNPKMVAEKASWDAVVMIFLAESIGFLALCISAWITSGMLPGLSVEDRIATFFSCIFKSEVLAIPLLSQVFVNSQNDLAILVVPSLLYHLIQSCGGSLLCFPLRRWRNRQHCKPGTTLLPLRYIRVSKHHQHLAPKTGGGSSSSISIDSVPLEVAENGDGTSTMEGGASPVPSFSRNHGATSSPLFGSDPPEMVPRKIGSE